MCDHRILPASALWIHWTLAYNLLLTSSVIDQVGVRKSHPLCK